MNQESKTVIYQLLGREQTEEYEHIIDSDNDMYYLKQLLRAELDFVNKNEKGIDKFLHLTMLRDDLEKYGISIEELKGIR